VRLPGEARLQARNDRLEMFEREVSLRPAFTT
jgi:hypothetical protein